MNESAVEEALDAVVVGGAGVDTNVYLYGDDIDWSAALTNLAAGHGPQPRPRSRAATA